jgi:hypothetical protein
MVFHGTVILSRSRRVLLLLDRFLGVRSERNTAATEAMRGQTANRSIDGLKGMSRREPIRSED